MTRSEDSKPSGGHPTGAAILLLVGVTVFLIAVSLASIQGWP